MLYDENGNPITNDIDLDNQDDDEIDTPDGHEEGDQDDDVVVTISKSELDRLKKQNEKLKSNKIKNIVKHKTQGSELAQKLQELEAKLTAKEMKEEEQEIKSMYADADIEQVRSLTSKWLTVKQAINALYSEQMQTKPNVWYAGRPAKPDTWNAKPPRWFEHWDKATQKRWKDKNWF